MIGLGINKGIKVLPDISGGMAISNGKYCKELEAVIRAAKRKGYQLPTDFQLRMLNFYIQEQISNSIWDKRDSVFMFGYNSLFTHYNNFGDVINSPEFGRRQMRFSLVDLKQPNRVVSLMSTDGTPFWNKAGIQNNNTVVASGYIDTGYCPNTSGNKWLQNDASFCFYLSKLGGQAADSSMIPFGIRDTTNSRRIASLQVRISGDITLGNLNRSNDAANSTFVASGVTEWAGYHSLDRTASNLTTYYKNGESAGTSAQASGTFNGSTLNAYLLAWNENGTAGFLYKKTPLGMWAGGGSLGARLQKIDNDIYKDFRTKLGYE